MRKKARTKTMLATPSGVPATMSVREAYQALGISRATFYRTHHKTLRYSLNSAGRRRYFVDDIRLLILLNTIVPDDSDAVHTRRGPALSTRVHSGQQPTKR
jgi:hypothetical protein